MTEFGLPLFFLIFAIIYIWLLFSNIGDKTRRPLERHLM
jgi:hypothetical protein